MISRADLLEYLGNLAAACRPPICWTKTGIDFTSERPTEQRAAAKWCERCPARTPCNEYGLTHLDEYGVYGALTDAARHRVITNPKDN